MFFEPQTPGSIVLTVVHEAHLGRGNAGSLPFRKVQMPLLLLLSRLMAARRHNVPVLSVITGIWIYLCPRRLNGGLYGQRSSESRGVGRHNHRSCFARGSCACCPLEA
jgi:hypothetical protein